MKKFFTSVLFFTLILNGYNQEWKVLNKDAGHFRTIDFINENVGWLAGDGTLLITEDSGNTWHHIETEDTLDFYHIDFSNQLDGWGTTLNKIIKTDDGGQTWKIKNIFDFLGPFQALNKDVAFVVGWKEDYDPRFYKTEDGGSTWDEIIIPTGKSISQFCFINSVTGIITMLGESDGWQLLRTTNGGRSWDEDIHIESGRIGNLQFVNDSTGYLSVYNEDSEETFIWATTDSGRTWTKKTKYNEPRDFFYKDENTAFAITENSDSLSMGGRSFNISKSTNGGLDWENTFDLGSIGFSAGFGSRYIYTKLYFINNTGYLIVGKGGQQLLRSIDGGNTWKFHLLTYPFYDVHFLDNDHGLACGGYVTDRHGPGTVGDVFRTNDGGQTWDLSLSAENIFRSLFFVNDYTGFALPEWGNTIYKTINRGDDWYLPHSVPDTGFVLNDIFFTDELTGWVCGLAILGTNDGGENWNLIWKNPDNDDDRCQLNSIHVVNNTAWVVGESGLMVKYTDQNGWQVQSAVTDLPLNDVFFSDAQHGWIAGGYGSDGTVHSILFHTKDAGRTWDDIRLRDYLIDDMYFADSLHGWAISGDTIGGIIIQTYDGGINWTQQVGDLPVSLRSLYFKNGIGWAVGGDSWGPNFYGPGQWGLILRTDNWTTWIDQNSGQVYPAKYQLSQNYPNPFNPITNIEYRISNFEHVELSIYNILGQKVATLVNKKQPAGRYQVEWDGGGFATGIYYYKFEAGDFQQVKKMVLMK